MVHVQSLEGRTEQHRLQRLAQSLEKAVCRWFANHPMEAFLVLLVGMPVGMLLAVTAFTVMLTLPLGLLLGWF